MEYDSHLDYFPLLLEFARNNPTYGKADWCNNFTCYTEFINNLEKTSLNFWKLKSVDFRNNFYWKWLCSDIQTQCSVAEELQKVRQSILSNIRKVDPYIFLTVNFDDTTNINASKMLTIAQSITKFRFFKSGMYVLEKHREKEGIHHHVHFLIKIYDTVKIGDIVKAIIKPKYVSDYVKGCQFIDIKVPGARKLEKRAQSYEQYVAYINGEKQDSKMPYVILDRTWRSNNSIKDLYEFENL